MFIFLIHHNFMNIYQIRPCPLSWKFIQQFLKKISILSIQNFIYLLQREILLFQNRGNMTC